MTKKEFIQKLSKSKKDVLQEFITLLKKKKIPFCVIGGLAVNAYAEPVVSLDLDIVISADAVDQLLTALGGIFKIKKFPNSINLTRSDSALRIQIQTDSRYQAFIPRSQKKNVLGYYLPVARVEDVLRGKLWAAADNSRRASKRQKDLADILRLLEVKKSLLSLVPSDLKIKLSL